MMNLYTNSGGNPINMGKPPCKNRTQDLLGPKSYPTPRMPLDYKVMDKMLFVYFLRCES
ncbi:hypothetical protein Hanom_Chr08g00703141 [Helianthus anomalus]